MWCAGCAKANHPGAVRGYSLEAQRKNAKKRAEKEGNWNRANRWCEDCHVMQASCGTEGAKTKRWCAGCAKANHPGAVSKKKMCDDCGKKAPSWGMADGKALMWCAGCAKANHPGRCIAGNREPRRERKRRTPRGARNGRGDNVETR
eukprot:COSAG06_NODE_3691_length_5003_cov_51.960440_6_plen_147_part_01